MKNVLFILFIVFTSCSFAGYYSDSEVQGINTEYSITSSGNISGDLIFYNNGSKGKYIESEFSYKCYTNSPYILFSSDGDDVTVTLKYEGVEYSETGGGIIIISVP